MRENRDLARSPKTTVGDRSFHRPADINVVIFYDICNNRYRYYLYYRLYYNGFLLSFGGGRYEEARGRSCAAADRARPPHSLIYNC